MARDCDRQVAEIQIRVAVLNRYTALGIPATEVVGQIRPGKGEVRSHPDFRNKARLIHKAGYFQTDEGGPYSAGQRAREDVAQDLDHLGGLLSDRKRGGVHLFEGMGVLVSVQDDQ